MEQIRLGAGTALATVLVTLVAIWNPLIVVALSAIVIGLIILTRIQGLWRRSFVVALVTLFAGSSSIEALASVGSVAKIGGVALLAIATVVTTRGRQAYQNRTHAALVRSLWLIVVFAGASVVWSQSKTDTIFDGMTFLVLVFVAHRISTTRWSDKNLVAGDIATWYWVSMAFLATGGVGAIVGLEGTTRPGGRHQWLFNNPNMLGLMAAITLTIGIGIALHYKRPVIWISLLIPTLGVVMSQSRTAMLAVAIGVAWVSLRQGAIGIARLAILATIGFFILQGTQAFGRFDAYGDNELSNRTLVWGETWSIIKDGPLGVGWAASPTVLEHLFLLGNTKTGLFNVHNSYFQFVLELGWAGIVPLAILLVVVATVLLRSSVTGLGAGLVATVMTGIALQITESVIFGVGSPYPWMYWLIVVAAAANIEPEAAAKQTRRRGEFYSHDPGIGKIRAIS